MPRTILRDAERLPSWPLGILVALLTWQVGMVPPNPGLDASWLSGLSTATHEGLQFGQEIVFSYGPLGFLQSQLVWYPDLGLLGFIFTSTVFVGFCIALVWVLRRVFPVLPSAVIAFLLLGVLPLISQALMIATIASLALLARERSQRLLWIFILAGASFAAVEALIQLSAGPLVLVLLLLALIGARASRLQIAAYLGLLAAELLFFWLITGQSLGAVPDFVANTLEIISGYSTAMLRDSEVASWKVTAATFAAVGISLGLLAASTQVEYRDRRARNWAIGLVALVAFVNFKEGVVRTDAGHLSLFFSTATVIWLAIPWARARWPWVLAGGAIIVALGIPVRPTGLPTNLDALDNLKFAGEQARTLLSPGRRDDLVTTGRAGMKSIYRLDPKTRAAVGEHSVAIEPWEIGVAWAYQFDWEPLPAFQNYSAYTTGLDELNAGAVESADGPERILRENEPLVFPEFPTRDIDGRFPGWDPPAQARAVLCNFEPLRTTERWQVLGRVADRCGPESFVSSAQAGEDEPVRVPAPGPGEAIFVRIGGAEVGGIERIANFLLHAAIRTITVNGTDTYRLVPETAGDGLLLRANGVGPDEGLFSPIPQARTLSVHGASGDLTYRFYRMKVGE